MRKFIIYSMQTGMILRTSGHEQRCEVGEGGMYVDLDGPHQNDATSMLDLVSMTMVPRPRLSEQEVFDIAADGHDAVRIALPAGTWARVILANKMVHQGELADDFAFSTFEVSECDVLFRPPFPYQEQQIRITAS